jgi:cell shape-determining protein MreC
MIIVPKSQSRLQLVRVFGALIIIASLVALDIPFGSWVSSFAREASRAGQYVQHRVPLIASMWRSLSDQGSLAQRTQELEEERARVRGLEARIANLEEQVVLYREAANIPDQVSHARIEGALSWFSPSQNARIAFIDRGSLDGVMVGDTVMRPPQMFVGVVSEVSEYQAQVRMAGDSLVQIPVQIAGSNASGLLRTDNEFGLIVDYVERGESLAEGARVVTSGADRTAPALVVGSVLGTIQDPAKLFQVVRVQVDSKAHVSGPVLIVRQP